MVRGYDTAETVDGKVDLFGHSGQAKMYHEFRPVYAPSLVEYILTLITEDHRDLYVDVACGSGQLTSLIAPYFQSTIGVDKSFEQLEQAPVNGDVNIEYLAGSAFELPSADGSVDLVTVGQALHWLVPYDRFFAEVSRVLRPGGVFLTVAYGYPRLANLAADRVSMALDEEILGSLLPVGSPGCWWGFDRATLDGWYANVPFPHNPSTRKWTQRSSMSVANFINYLETMSAYNSLIRAGRPDPLPEVQRGILSAIGSENVNDTIEVEFPFFSVSYVHSL